MVNGPTNEYGFVELKDDFLGPTLLTWLTGNTENSGTAAILVGQEDGLVNLITGTTSGNRAQLVGGLNFRADRGGPLVVSARIQPHTSVASVTYFVGFTSSASIATPIVGSGTANGVTVNTNDSVGVLYSTAMTTTQLCAVGAKGSAATTPVFSGITPVAETVYEIRVEVDVYGNARFFINQQQFAEVKNCITPSTLVAPTVNVHTLTTAAKTLYCDYVIARKGRNAAGG